MPRALGQRARDSASADSMPPSHVYRTPSAPVLQYAACLHRGRFAVKGARYLDISIIAHLQA
jgi:hypothetical protein